MSEYEYAADEDIEEMMGVEPRVRYEGNTAYVQTLQQALAVSDQPSVKFVVIEDNTERIKYERLVKALRLR